MGTVKYVVEVLFFLLPFLAMYVFFKKPSDKRKLYRHSVAVLVLGDIGRSPRMMYHSQSFAQREFETFIIGYRGKVHMSSAACSCAVHAKAADNLPGSKPPKSLRSLPHVHFLYLATPPEFISRAPRWLFPILGPLKAIFQALAVLNALLLRLPYPPKFIIVQVSGLNCNAVNTLVSALSGNLL